MNKKLYYIQWVIVSCLLILVGLLASQNFSLKTKLIGITKSSQYGKSRFFEAQLKKNLLLKSIPVSLKLDECYFQTENIASETNGQIIVIFDLTVCGKCLHKGLIAMKYFQQAALRKGIQYKALVGIKSKQEEAQIIGLYHSGLLSFPCKTIVVEDLYKKFSLDIDRFIDTPFYVFMDDENRVIDIFKPVKFEVKELMLWLETLTA